MSEITGSLFCVYLRHLRQHIRDNAKFDVITDANVLDFMNDELFYGFLMSFFEDQDDPISQIAIRLYNKFESEKRCYNNTRSKFETTETYRHASAIKNLLRVIKYSCTIFEESQKSKAIFFCSTVFSIFRNDNYIDPTNWTYITAEQFEAKLIATFYGKVCLMPLCPVTNFRLKEVYELFNGYEQRPLLVLNEENYNASIENFIKNYIKGEKTEDVFGIHSRANSKSLFLSASGEPYDKPYSNTLEPLYNKLKELFETNREVYKNYSLILALEYYPSKAYGVIIVFKLFIFKKEKDVGYVLDACLTNKISDQMAKNVFFTKMVSNEVIESILRVCYEHYKAQLSNEDAEKIDSDNKPFIGNAIKSSNGVTSKEYRLVQGLYKSFRAGNYKPQVPNFIVYP